MNEEQKAIDSSNDNINHLIELTTKYPNLPVVPMVQSEIVQGHEFGRWLGSIGKARYDRYFIGEDRVYFYDENNIEDCVNDSAVIWDVDNISSDEEARRIYRALPWKEAIIVDINLPEV